MKTRFGFKGEISFLEVELLQSYENIQINKKYSVHKA